MKNIQKLPILTFMVLAFLLSSCASKLVRKEFEPGKKIQVIKFDNTSSLFAQEDTLLDIASLDKKLSTQNPKWETSLKSAGNYDSIATTSSVLQLVSLFMCIGSVNIGNVFGWCGASIGFGLLGALPAHEHAEELRREVVEDYNKSLPSNKWNVSIP